MTLPTPVGLPTLEEALGQAAVDEAYVEPESTDDLFEAEPPTDKAPAPVAGEQTQQEPTAPKEQADESLFGDLEAEPDPQGIDWNATVVLPGEDQPITLSELRDGHLRQADYTRKTQALAEERRAFEEENKQAIGLWRALNEDPSGTAAFLAVEAKIVDAKDVAGKVRALQGVWKPPPSREEAEAELQKRVAAEVEKHPVVLKAKEQALITEINAQFAAIEKKFSITLTEKDQARILGEAIKARTDNLELVTEGLLHRAEKKRLERESAQAAAPSRPGVRAPSSGPPAKIESISDALEQALADSKGGSG